MTYVHYIQHSEVMPTKGYPGGHCYLRNNSLMSCFMLILTWGGIIFDVAFLVTLGH
jgi:hypothetical protein